jgi:hypothetical protein
MKMPNANGMLTHQLTLDHSSNSLEELCAAMNRQEFLVFHLFYRRRQPTGEVWWQDRGNVIINTSCIGKAQEFIDMDLEENIEDPNRGASLIRTNPTGYRNQRPR